MYVEISCVQRFLFDLDVYIERYEQVTWHMMCIQRNLLGCMGWLRLVGSLKIIVSFAKKPYKREDILQKRPTILMSLLHVATPYAQRCFVQLTSFRSACQKESKKSEFHFFGYKSRPKNTEMQTSHVARKNTSRHTCNSFEKACHPPHTYVPIYTYKYTCM